MDPGRLIPYPDILPAPWSFFHILLVITFFLHILMANTMLGTGIVLLVKNIHGRGSAEKDISREIGDKLPMSIAFTVNLGVAPLLFLQVTYGQFIYVSSVLMAVYWVSIFLLIILAYYSAYIYKFGYESLGMMRALPVGLSVILLLVVGFFFTNSTLLMIDPKAWPQYFQNPNGTIIHTGEPSLIPRYLHFVVSSVAIGGLVFSIFGWFKKRRGEAEMDELEKNGLLVYGFSTMSQFVIGAWYLGTLPNYIVGSLFFESHFVFPIFLFSIVAALASIFFSFGRRLWHTVISCVATIFLMVLFRFAVRSGYLDSYIASSRPEVISQFGAFMMFLIALIIGIITVIYMLKLALRAGKEHVA
ncbi:MAG: hypothetical protein SV775_10365 [Thermodesulfobacteriota bacterium]|nr:hypothetical protein [Thermodesulfobacteriota bacterium]